MVYLSKITQPCYQLITQSHDITGFTKSASCHAIFNVLSCINNFEDWVRRSESFCILFHKRQHITGQNDESVFNLAVIKHLRVLTYNMFIVYSLQVTFRICKYNSILIYMWEEW